MADDAPQEDAAPPSRPDSIPLDAQSGLPRGSGPPRRSWSSTRHALLLGVAFVAPCAVIGASLYFIVRGGAPPSGAASSTTLASSAAPAGSAAPTADAEPAGVAFVDEDAGAPPLEKGGLAEPFDDEGSDQEPVSPTAPSKPAPPKHFTTVQLAAAGSCSTESVDGLSRQIIEQARCIKPNDFVALPKRPNLLMDAHVFPYLELAARDHLVKALDAHSGDKMTVHSVLRTVAQQYLVWHWAASKSCGVQLATPPGESNHEIGTALDIAEAAKWRPALEAQDFKWLGTVDRVHFDYKGQNASPHTATDVLAFQKLWNRNHHEDAIPEDGRYSPATEQRLKKAPPAGFPLGSSCAKAAAAAHH